MNRRLSRDAMLAICLGSALTQAAALFGIPVSIIAWTAWHSGAPDAFLLGPLICAGLMIYPVLRRASMMRVLKSGQEVEGRWASVERHNVLVQRPRGGGDWVVTATWVYRTASGREFNGRERMRVPNAPDANEPVELLSSTAGAMRVLRPASLHRRLRVSNAAVTTDHAMWSMSVLPALFAMINVLFVAL